jgi:ATP-dependent RNA helicase RhlE
MPDGSNDALGGSPTAPTFADLGLSKGMLRIAAELGYTEPTPIQAAALPPALAGRDVLATAATGSGKTVAYGFAALQRIDNIARPTPRRPRLLVLVPTRELAAQVGETLRQGERGLNIPAKLSVLYGGVSINPQLMALRGGTDAVVATPGRLLDVVRKNALDLSGLHTLVLDEADRLLEGGFADELQQVLALLPVRRQNLLFSATFPSTVQQLAQTLLREPVHVDVSGDAAAAPDITERAITVDAARRTPLLARLIAQEQWPRVLVFVATRYACDHVADKLRRAGLAAEAFHGAKPHAPKPWPISRPGGCRCWCPPIWAPAASTSHTCRWW